MDAGNKKHTQHAASTKTECDYLNGWIEKPATYAKISPKMVNPRDIAGEHRRRRTQLCGLCSLEETTATLVYGDVLLRITAATVQFLPLTGKKKLHISTQTRTTVKDVTEVIQGLLIELALTSYLVSGEQ